MRQYWSVMLTLAKQMVSIVSLLAHFGKEGEAFCKCTARYCCSTYFCTTFCNDVLRDRDSTKKKAPGKIPDAHCIQSRIGYNFDY